MTNFVNNKIAQISIKMILVLFLLKWKWKCKIWTVLEKSLCKPIKLMSKFHISMQILHGNALLSGEIYTAGKVFARAPIMMVMTNIKSENLWYVIKNHFGESTHPSGPLWLWQCLSYDALFIKDVVSLSSTHFDISIQKWYQNETSKGIF